MAREIPVKSLIMLAGLATLGVGLAPVGASAASLAVHVTPSIGHPLSFDLRDQVRFPRIQGQVFMNDPGPPSGPTGPWHILKKPVHRTPTQAN
jgi:hypothetical protein